MKHVSKKKKIAFLTHMYYPSNLTGSCIVISNLAELFLKEGNDVAVITSLALDKKYWYIPFFKHINKKKDSIEGINIIRLNVNHLISFISFLLSRYLHFFLSESLNNKLSFISRGPYFKGIKKLLENEEFDIVFSSPFPYYLNKQLAEAIKTIDKKPLFIFEPEYHFLLKEYRNPEFKYVFDNADYIHVWTNSEKDKIESNFKTDPQKIKVIKNAFIYNKININKKIKQDFVNKYNIKNRKIILYAGVKSRYKGSFFILKNINELYKKDKSYLLIALGQNTFGWNLRKKIINKNCLLDLGYVPESLKEVIFDISDLYCMPSISEALGLSYLEAWYRKKPVIAARFSVTEEIIESNNGGILVNFNNDEELKETIEKLFKNRKLARRLGNNGHSALIKKYSFNKGTEKYIKLFDARVN